MAPNNLVVEVKKDGKWAVEVGEEENFFAICELCSMDLKLVNEIVCQFCYDKRKLKHCEPEIVVTNFKERAGKEKFKQEVREI